ncbi:MBL fold metallo-hydrolase RNA specificity domain-containing protein [Sulfolobus sp. E11-6]|uniref:MBL fold metallo-hydrolase RNA specificity domain-containing protein n=1 Tax=Sulfolobus sp. E11-6 TaxID=2663020 RepID=UPI0012951B1E|nr:MBL fold metallo-hydrolase RNA specificity domain-containing protein [Sulfolobus sp. E11-6]QGA69064.1 MBL fold metallo-hydrolase [Sulfolobus sp. E11-6]
MIVKLSDVEVNILQGFNEIGGNCIEVKGKDTHFFLDKGIRFSRFKKFYKGNIGPSSTDEMIELGIIPNITTQVNIYISHYHLDHLGILFSLPPESKLFLPDKEIFEEFIDHYKTSNTWTTYIQPRLGVELKNAKTESEDNVIPIDVEHSAYPAVAYYYNGANDRILYTGDFRLNSLIKNDLPDIHNLIHQRTLLEEVEEKGYDVDLLLIEGTNFSSPTFPISPPHFISALESILFSHKNSLIFVTTDILDLESFLEILKVAENHERIPVIFKRRLAKMVKVWNNMWNFNKNIHELMIDQEISMNFDIIDKDEISRSPSDYIIFTTKDEIIDLARKMRIPGSSVVISLSTEAKGEGSEDESVEDTWFKILGLISYRLRVSGHYYPYELKTILDTIKPKKVVPIHTESTTTMCEYIRSLGYTCSI